MCRFSFSHSSLRPNPPGNFGPRPGRRRRRVGGPPRGGCATPRASAPGRAPWGWTLHPAVVARLTRARRPRGAARGRRWHPWGQGAAGVREPVALCPGSHHCGGPPASCRQPQLTLPPPHGRGAAPGWRPWTPARAAGWPAPGWARTEVRSSRGPPGPPPHGRSPAGAAEGRAKGREGLVSPGTRRGARGAANAWRGLPTGGWALRRWRKRRPMA